MTEESRDDTVELIAVQGEIEANVIKSLLGSAGIISLVKSDIVQGVTPITIDGLGVMRIFVKKSDLARAKELIDDYRRGA